MDAFVGQIGEALTSTLSASDPPKTIITDNFAMAVAVIDAANPQTLNTSAMTDARAWRSKCTPAGATEIASCHITNALSSCLFPCPQSSSRCP